MKRPDKGICGSRSASAGRAPTPVKSSSTRIVRTADCVPDVIGGFEFRTAGLIKRVQKMIKSFLLGYWSSVFLAAFAGT